MLVVESPAELRAWVNRELGPSTWVTVTQQMIDAFADVTGDHQWIHTDKGRAQRELPKGRTIAQGYLILSLLPRMQLDLWEIHGVGKAINYGAERLRFINPVSADSRVRLRVLVKSVETMQNAVRLLTVSTLEMENEVKPALVIENINLLFA